MARLAQRLGAGLLAGISGTAAMTASSTAEMRLRGRPPSRAPVDVAEKLLGVQAGGGERLATVAHLFTGVGLGVVAAALGVRRARGFFALSMLPELVLVPALTEVEAPWRWTPTEAAISAGHHIVYAAAAAGALAAADPHGV